MTFPTEKTSKVVAFVTDEYPLSSPNGGGLATYVEKTAKTLLRLNYNVHVFLPGGVNEVVIDDGVVVHFVSNPAPKVSWWINKVTPKFMESLAHVLMLLIRSYALATAIKKYEIHNGEFSLIQSCDYQFRGLFVGRSRRRKHIVRCSWARDVFERADGQMGFGPSLSAFLERVSMRRADLVYAPSSFVAKHFSLKYSIPVKVVRPSPPVLLNTPPLIYVRPPGVPDRYFFHFGQLCVRKGTDLILDASEKLKQEGVQILIAGIPKDPVLFERISCSNVSYLGALTRSEVVSYLRGCLCAVLPSRVDNLPNTAIESLALGIPVLTLSSNGVDEIIEDGVNGWIVSSDSKDSLADRMREIWIGDSLLSGPVQLPDNISFALSLSVFEENLSNLN